MRTARSQQLRKLVGRVASLIYDRRESSPFQVFVVPRESDAHARPCGMLQVIVTSSRVMEIKSGALEHPKHIFRRERRETRTHAGSGTRTRISSLTVLSDGIGR